MLSKQEMVSPPKPCNRSPSVAFRVDASTKIGTGHVVRCLTLAKALRERGAKTNFICRAHPGHMADQIKSAGHSLTLLTVDEELDTAACNNQLLKHAIWLGAMWEKDAAETIKCLHNETHNWLVVDHYAIDARWETKVKNTTGIKIMVIDGLGDRAHDCDILLDQTYTPEGVNRWKGLVPPVCNLYIGPQYALLRPEFIKARKKLRKRDGTVRRILVAFGGVDEPNATAVALEAIITLNRRDIFVDVVVGSGYLHLHGLINRCQPFTNIKLFIQPTNIAELMASADLAIGGGGMMMWERCALGLPSLIIATAHNQILPARELSSLGATDYLGSLDQVDIKSVLIDKLNTFINDPQYLKSFERKSLLLMPRLTANFMDDFF